MLLMFSNLEVTTEADVPEESQKAGLLGIALPKTVERSRDS
jgi:hypothetical protein